MVTAHGASERTLATTRALGLEVVEATCPLVHVAHRAVRALVRDGYHPVIIGQRAHVEVRGLTEDLDRVRRRSGRERCPRCGSPAPRFGIAAQTTQPIEKVRHLVDADSTTISPNRTSVSSTPSASRPKSVRLRPSISPANAMSSSSLAARTATIRGSSSNTCRRHCALVHHVQTAAICGRTGSRRRHRRHHRGHLDAR